MQGCTQGRGRITTLSHHTKASLAEKNMLPLSGQTHISHNNTGRTPAPLSLAPIKIFYCGALKMSPQLFDKALPSSVLILEGCKKRRFVFFLLLFKAEPKCMQINDVYIFRLRTVTSMFLNGEGVGPRLSGLCVWVCVFVCLCV